MGQRRNMVFPIIMTVLIIVIIIYLIGSVRQPYVSCSRSTVDDLGIKLVEDLVTTLDNNKIKKMELTKTIILPEKYLSSDKYLEEIKFALIKAYDYLGKFAKVYIESDRVIVSVNIEDDQTIILKNIEFFDEDGLVVKVNPNTKSSDVVTLSISDKYSEGEFMSRMKNNGYMCK